MEQKVFVTDNFKLAMALTAAGFSIRNAHDVIVRNRDQSKFPDRKSTICELDPDHNGVTADYLRGGFEYDPAIKGYRVNLVDRVNEIIEARGISQEEYVILAFDSARAAMHNRATVLHCLKNNKPLIAIKLKDERTLIYVDGVPRDQIKHLLEDA